MSLSSIKEEVVSLCADLQTEDMTNEQIEDRIFYLRKRLMPVTNWIEKNENQRVMSLGALYRAYPSTGAPYSQTMWLVNCVDGYLEEAIRINNEEWQKGIPKALKPAFSNENEDEDEAENWIETYVRSSDEFISTDKLYSAYSAWSAEENIVALNPVNFGKRLKQAGFEAAVKKIAGKTQRGWKAAIRTE